MIDYPDEWDKEGLLRDFDVEGFYYDLCIVTRKADGAKGTLLYRRDPNTNTRVYYGWAEA